MFYHLSTSQPYNKKLGHLKVFYIFHSAVARVPCALGQEILLRPLSTKSTEFEVKNRCKNLEAKIVLF